MNFPTNFVRAFLALFIIAAPGAAVAKINPDLAKVEAHLEAFHTMTADFSQTDQKGRTLNGTLQLKRPGRIRFDYGKDANMLLVSDGRKLTFIDYTVGQKSSWDVNHTPLGILLQEHPDLSQIAHIVPSGDPRVVVVRAMDPARQEFGKLILAFIRDPSAPAGLRLYGWTAEDAQGKRTTVRLSNQHYNVPVPDSAFTYAEPKKRG